MELFRTNHSNLEVAIKVGLTDSETEEELKQYRRLINMDRFCQFFYAMNDNLEYHLQLYSELSNANLTIHEAIEGLRYAQPITSMKLEYANLQNSLRQIRFESFEAWKRLQILKLKNYNISNRLEPLKGMDNDNSNETYFPEPNNSMSFARARRRRRTHKSSDDFKTDRPAS